MTKINIDLKKLLVKSFRKQFLNILDCKYNRMVFKGGRSSTKSSMIAMAIVLGVFMYRADAICMVKYQNMVKKRLCGSILTAMNRLGLREYFKYNKTECTFTLLDENKQETLYKIYCMGVEDPEKIKSFTPDSGAGGCRYIWFEEATNFYSYDEVNDISVTMARGDGGHTTILSYNPEMGSSHWTKVFDKPCGKALGHKSNEYITTDTTEVELNGKAYTEVRTELVHHSTYLDVVDSGFIKWLGEAFSIAVKAMKDNPLWYRWKFLGEMIGTEGNVFLNVKVLNHDNFNKDVIYRGLDFGFTKDPSAYVEWVYDRKEHAIYCVNEYGGIGLSNSTLAEEIKVRNKHNFKVWADSQEPRTINELLKLGLKVVGVPKGPDSVRFGVRWLQSLTAIYIDPIKCPNTYKEFKEYEYKQDKHGNYTGELVDSNNHYIDATRYALNVVMTNY